jgi:uncharacterized membrane protein YeaQ/YmgE (transglycosylase-associated protein family)
MTLVELLVLLIIAAIAGVIGQLLGGYKQRGIIVAIVLGFLGALLGAWLADTLGLPRVVQITVGGIAFPLLWAIIGAGILVALGGVLGARGFNWSITPPTKVVLLISVLLAVLAALINFGILSVSLSSLTLLAIAYGLLLLGNLFKGL